MQTTWRTLLRMLLALALLTGVAACGDDDEDGDTAASASSSASTATGDDDGSEDDEADGDFCGALQAFHGQLFEVQVEDDATEAEIQDAYDTLDPLWSDVEAAAPDDFSGDVETLGSTIDALGEGDVEPFNADDTSTTYFSMVSEALDGCVDEIIEVTGVDYAFTGVPETVPSGPIGMRFTNGTDADEQHELIIFKKADGDTRSAEEILNDPAAQEQGPGQFAGAVFATPGTTAGTFLDLAPGDYIAVCFIPVGSGEHEMPEGEADDSMEDAGEDQAADDQAPEEEGEGGPPHFTQGMVAEFSVA